MCITSIYTSYHYSSKEIIYFKLHYIIIQILEAIKVLEVEMPAVGVKPNENMLRLVITRCAKRGYVPKAFDLYEKVNLVI